MVKSLLQVYQDLLIGLHYQVLLLCIIIRIGLIYYLNYERLV